MSKPIIRIVRLSFEPNLVTDFLHIFDESKAFILGFDGCEHLELLQDIHHDNVYYTYSKWISPDALESYRHSELFKSTWAKTKVLFNAKPVAYSIQQVQ